MGYTHYWALDPAHPEVEEGFARTLLDARRIIDAAEVPLTSGHDPRRPPELTEERLRLGGVDTNAHETFELTRHPGDLDAYSRHIYAERDFVWSFCKTDRKPYDLVVAAVLLRAVAHMPTAFVIGSDGLWEHEWWAGCLAWQRSPGMPPPRAGEGARQLVRRLFGPAADPTVSPLTTAAAGPPSVRHAGRRQPRRG